MKYRNTILIASADLPFATNLRAILEKSGYDAVLLEHGHQILSILSQTTGAVGLCDIELMYPDGRDLLSVAGRHQAERLFALISPDSPHYLVDYSTCESLRKRANAHSFALRLTRRLSSMGSLPSTDIASAGGLRVSRRRSLACFRKKSITLRPIAANLLWLLLAAANEEVTRAALLRAAGIGDTTIQPASLNQYMKYLRMQLALIQCPDRVEPVRGKGYRYVCGSDVTRSTQTSTNRSLV